MSRFVSATGLSLIRGDAQLCRDFSLELAAGECVHLEGPNGSGKTTLLHALCGLFAPEEGRVTWHDGLVATQAHYCGHQNALKEGWTVAENLRWSLRLSGCRVDPQQWDDGLDAMRLGLLADMPVERLSQGERRRAALMRLVLMPRPVWLLDEPFNALDLAAQSQLVAWMNGHTQGGGAILFSSHAGQPAGLRLTRRVSMQEAA